MLAFAPLEVRELSVTYVEPPLPFATYEFADAKLLQRYFNGMATRERLAETVAIRYAEPAGSRRSDAHWQLDLNYTQNVRLSNRFNLQPAADLFNVFNQQTGYNIQPSIHDSTYGQPRTYYDPRRLQIAARLTF